MFGPEAPGLVVLSVQDVVGGLGTLDPEHSSLLSRRIVEEHEAGHAVALDFTGTGTVSSAFANALFLSLNQVRPLSAWRQTLTFRGLRPGQAEVVRKSLQAAQRFTTREGAA